MRPGLGPVLPGVSAGVSGDERIRPVNRRALFVVEIERLVVILTLVTEEPAKLIDLVGPVNQPVPEVMADLVPEVAQ